MKTRDERRAERERVITRRLNIIKGAWREREIPYFTEHVGRLSKFNLKCTCAGCKQPRYERAAEKQQERIEAVSP